VWERPKGNDAARGRALALCLCLSDNGFGVTQVLRMACGDWFNRWLPFLFIKKIQRGTISLDNNTIPGLSYFWFPFFIKWEVECFIHPKVMP
jgi:hypothetical protein